MDASTASADDQQAILALEQARHRALVQVDLAALSAMFDDELVHVHSTGLVHGKAELLAHIGHKRGFLGIERGPLQLRVVGGIAVLSGPMTSRMRGKDGHGEELMRSFVTQVLRRHADGWKFCNFQLTLSRES